MWSRRFPHAKWVPRCRVRCVLRSGQAGAGPQPLPPDPGWGPFAGVGWRSRYYVSGCLMLPLTWAPASPLGSIVGVVMASALPKNWLRPLSTAFYFPRLLPSAYVEACRQIRTIQLIGYIAWLRRGGVRRRPSPMSKLACFVWCMNTRSFLRPRWRERPCEPQMFADLGDEAGRSLGAGRRSQWRAAHG